MGRRTNNSEPTNQTDAKLRKVYNKLSIGTDIEFAKYMDIPISNIRGWRARDSIPRAVLVSIHKKTGIPLDFLLDTDVPAYDINTAKHIALSHATASILHMEYAIGILNESLARMRSTKEILENSRDFELAQMTQRAQPPQSDQLQLTEPPQPTENK